MDRSNNRIKQVVIFLSVFSCVLFLIPLYVSFELNKQKEKSLLGVVFVLFLYLIIAFVPQMYNYLSKNRDSALREKVINGSSRLTATIVFSCGSLIFILVGIKNLLNVFFESIPKASNDFIDFVYLMIPILGFFSLFVAKEQYKIFQQIFEKSSDKPRSPQ